MLELFSGVFVQSLKVEWVLGRNIFAAKQGCDMATKMFLMPNNFIQGNLVLYEKGNFNVELIDILLSHFVLTYVLNDGLP